MQEALILTSLANLDTLGEIEVRLTGNCMWPIVRNQDLIRLEKFPYSSLRPGDVMIFQTTETTLHANTLFRKIKPGEPVPQGYVGKVSQLERRGKILHLNERSLLKRIGQMLCSPANPYCLGLLPFLLRKWSRRPMSV